jgi:signal transduction histidine kinase/CheY-like chemotaxis protein
LIYIVLIVPFAYILNYPFSLVADLGILVLILITFIVIILMAIASFKRKHYPSQIFLAAYIIVSLGLLIHLLKEFNVIDANFFVINSIKIGLTIQNILLTIAVLERFRYNQESAKKIIHDNLIKIEIQNKEFEIINTELEKLSIVASETDNSIAIYDNSGRLEWGNSGFEKLYEVRINDIIKNNKDQIEQIIPNENIRQYVNKCQETKLPVVFETPVMTKNSEQLWVQTTLSPFIRAGIIHKIIAIDSDITSLKTYEKELETAKEKAEESDQLKTAFLHNISHEIRTPLNAIVGFSGFLNDDKLTAVKREQFIDIILQSSDQLLSIISDIINIASIEAGQEKITENPLDLNATLGYIYEQYLPMTRQKNISLILKPDLPYIEEYVLTDETKLVQILTNLIDNALKFTKTGYVNFGYTIRDKEIEFFVEDTGIGIAPEMHHEIFKRFRQVESSNTRQFGGSGLGLSISKAYVELLGGRMWLTSELDKGSVFYFTIPFKTTVLESLQEKKTGTGLKINNNEEIKTLLVAEDEDSNFMVLEAALSGLNVNIIRARNGVEAIETCRSKRVDMILMDIKMPIMDGYEATRQIRDFMPDLPIIAQTAYTTEPDKNRALACGCTDFISKPLKQDTIISMVKGQLNLV